MDELPTEQYLFVNTHVEEDNIQTSFVVDNRNFIDPEIYGLIASHYQRLFLCKRFSENAAEVITSLGNSISPYKDKLSQDDIIEATKEKIAKDRIAFGFNYWKSLLELSLIENTHYLIMIFENTRQ